MQYLPKSIMHLLKDCEYIEFQPNLNDLKVYSNFLVLVWMLEWIGTLIPKLDFLSWILTWRLCVIVLLLQPYDIYCHIAIKMDCIFCV